MKEAVAGPAIPLRAWWACGGLLLLGLAVVGLTGRVLVGGALMAAAFVVAAGLRAVLPPQRAGGLNVRTRPLDLLFYVAAAVNVLGGVLLVLHHAPLRLVVGADVVLAAALGWLWFDATRWWRR